MYDQDTGEFISAQFHSGDDSHAPIPNGRYDILGHGGKEDFFRLESVDIPYGDDINQRTNRSEFRLHKPGGSWGCITANKWDGWKKIKSFIGKTKASTVQVPSKYINPIKRWRNPTETLPWYGRIDVISYQ